MVGGLCTDVPCTDHLDLNYFTEQKIRYNFEFEMVGIVYAYIGEKIYIYPWNLIVRPHYLLWIFNPKRHARISINFNHPFLLGYTLDLYQKF